MILFLTACSPAPAPTAAPTAAPAAPTTPAPSPTAAPSALPTLTPAPSPVAGGLFVDPARRLGPISRLSFGSNYGPWSIVPPGAQDPLLASGLTFLRFPGGNWGDEHDMVADQIDDFIALCRKLKAEPGISVRLRGGTPERAAALVRYVNKTKAYAVRYWSIGNEPTLYGDYDIPRYNREWRAIAQAMRAVDPQIALVGPDVHQFDADGTFKDGKERYTIHEFMRAFLKTNGDLVNIISLHRYPFPAGRTAGDPSAEELRASAHEWDAMLPALRALIRESAGRDLPLAVTEVNANWNGSFGGDTTPDAPLGAVWWADVLGRLIRQRVEIVAQFSVFAPQSEGWGLLTSFSTRPQYYVYQLYLRFGDELLYASSDDPDVSITAAQRADGTLTLMIVNLGAQPATKRLMLGGGTLPAAAETWLLDKTHKAKQVEPTLLGANATLTLPAESVTLLVMPRS